jgi:hypothetical protein
LKLVIEAEWRKIELGKSHFEILYQARVWGSPEEVDTTIS